MRRQNAMMGIGLLALGLCAVAAPVLAQSSHFPSARKLDDNGSVNEPGPAGGNSAIAQPVRARRLENYRAATPPRHQHYPSVRKADDNGSVDEPGFGN